MDSEVNLFLAAEKLLRGELSVEEFQEVNQHDYSRAVLELAKRRAHRVKPMGHVWYRTTYGDAYLEAFEAGDGVHVGLKCARCDYQQCVVCQACSEGYELGQHCTEASDAQV